MNQRMVPGSRSGSITFWAWAVSVVVHLVVLGVFGFIKFSQAKVQPSPQITPTAKVNQIKKIINAGTVIPKPKVKKTFERTPKIIVPPSKILSNYEPDRNVSADMPQLGPSAKELFATAAVTSRGTEFFGSFTDQRKICYVVDCSGSMHGVFGRVQKKLIDSIAALQPDQYFYIIFFGDNKLLEIGDGLLLRASDKAKQDAYNFIRSAQPAGRTNATAALERAVQIRDNANSSPSVIYFLTDGFELTGKDVMRFSQSIINLRNRFAPKTKINTIAFWPQSSDRKMLETIAKKSGGEFILITDGLI